MEVTIWIDLRVNYIEKTRAYVQYSTREVCTKERKTKAKSKSSKRLLKAKRNPLEKLQRIYQKTLFCLVQKQRINNLIKMKGYCFHNMRKLRKWMIRYWFTIKSLRGQRQQVINWERRGFNLERIQAYLKHPLLKEKLSKRSSTLCLSSMLIRQR